ncbi:MAG: ATP-binding protein [Pyrinomonadaceae bacterium]
MVLVSRATPFIVTEETTEIQLPGGLEAINDAVARALEIARRAGFDDDALFGIDMAVREAVVNAFVHGNGQDETKHIDLSFARSESKLEIRVRDCGEGFNPDSVADPTAPQNLLKASGRGILFMRAYMDEVEYNTHADGGTIVRMMKKL